MRLTECPLVSVWNATKARRSEHERIWISTTSRINQLCRCREMSAAGVRGQTDLWRLRAFGVASARVLCSAAVGRVGRATLPHHSIKVYAGERRGRRGGGDNN